ncbi:MAG: xanthine dehydrogenase family protein molybdopterin-binding subunit [Spirochaetia bacterium]|nr:xanthine dehydrogenase family protein molybdopterin-binding subunit [Spirochaetia bacterium]
MGAKISIPVRRIDAKEKAGGWARYIADYEFENLQHGRFLRSERARAKIIEIKKPVFPDGYYYVDASDIPSTGMNNIHMIKDDWRVFAVNEVRYIGETIAIIIGPDKQKVLGLMEKIEVVYEDLEPAFTFDDSLSCKGGAVFGDNNIFAEYLLNVGNTENAFKSAVKIVEGKYETGFQEHLYMETQGLVGTWEDDKITIYASSQCPFYIRKSVAGTLGVPLSDIRVRQVTTGGAFGGKEHFPDVIATPLAVAVNKIKKPISMIYDRIEDISFTSKRHPSKIKIKTGLDKDNNIIAMDIDTLVNGGAYESSTPIVLQRAILHGIGVYKIPNARILGKALATNTFPSDAYRGFGAPQGLFAIEMHMTHIAEELGLNSSDFRRKHFIKTNDTTITNSKMHDDVKLEEMFAKIDEMSDYSSKVKKFANDPVKGIGIAFVNHGGGFTGNGEQAVIQGVVKMKRLENGKAGLYVSVVEMGQGLQTTMRKIAAKELGMNIDDIIYNNPDTDLVPDSGPTCASRSIMVVGFLIQECAKKLKVRWNEGVGVETTHQYKHPEEFVWEQDTLQGDAYPSYGWGVNVIEVEFDPVSYEIKTTGIWAVWDVGVAIDETIMNGQSSGGVIQALGWASIEKCELKNGAFMQHTMADYTIPTSLDFPKVETAFIDNPYKYGPSGAKGAGELVFDAAPPAYAEAVQNAIGKRIYEIPVTPEMIMETLK